MYERMVERAGVTAKTLNSFDQISHKAQVNYLTNTVVHIITNSARYNIELTDQIGSTYSKDLSILQY